MSTRSQIQAEVLRIVEDHVDVVTAAIPTHIQRAQRAIESRCAFLVQYATVTYQVEPLSSSYAKPADFLGVRRAPYFIETSSSSGYKRLREDPDFESRGLLTTQGVPKYWRDENDASFSFWPIGDGLGPSGTTAGAYDVVVPYYKSLSALASDNDTNYWSQNFDDVLAWRAAAFVFADMRDPQANWWSAVAAARFNEIRSQLRRNRARQQDGRIFPAESLSSETQFRRRWRRRTWLAEVP